MPLPSPGVLPGRQGQAGRAVTDPAAVEVLATLHEDNQSEIELGALAQARGQAEAVRQFGAMLVSEHTEADEKLIGYAADRTIDLARAGRARPGPVESPTRAQLDELHGAEFDRAFIALTIEDHEEVVAYVREARGRVQDGALRALLGELEPVLDRHLEHARALAADSAREHELGDPHLPTRQGRPPEGR
jgi:putative membrane protein